MLSKPEISKTRLTLGATILVLGFMSPILIPTVASTVWSVGVKGAISGLLAFGIPEIMMIIAVAVLGKAGYEYLKQKALFFLKRFAPSDTVSPLRYRIGLIMFTVSLLGAWAQPYLAHFFPDLHNIPVWVFIIGDFIFIFSFFVLGGNFWDKFSGLFYHSVTVVKEQ